MPLDRADGMRLERPVTLADMKAVHKRCKGCLGRFMVKMMRRRGAKLVPEEVPCVAGMREFAEYSRGRIEEGPGGDAWWMAGCAPEQWAFMEMWIVERMEWAWRQDFARQSRILGVWWKHQAQQRVQAEHAGDRLGTEIACPS